MNKEKTKQKIEKLKSLYPDNEEQVKSGKIYHRFVVQKIEFPEELGKKYLQVAWDDNNTHYVILNVLEGISEEEKEKRKQERMKKIEARRKDKQDLLSKIKNYKSQIKSLVKQMKFTECEDVKKDLDVVMAEYRMKFTRQLN